jgi:hypothetical protein
MGTVLDYIYSRAGTPCFLYDLLRQGAYNEIQVFNAFCLMVMGLWSSDLVAPMLLFGWMTCLNLLIAQCIARRLARRTSLSSSTEEGANYEVIGFRI